MGEIETFDLEKEEKVILNKNKIRSKFFYNFVKRLLDILGSFFGLILLAPLFLVVAYKIKKEDPSGPVFFSQDRVGKDEKIFKMYKFRSMCTDAEEKLKDLLEHNEVDGPMFKIKEDPRVTKIGKFIRKTSIDELPQLWNVLKGEMTLVGPRPPLIREVYMYTEYDKQRLMVKPGCTGVWQVSGRNDLHFDEMVELDLKYIECMSLKNDLKIIVKTICIIINPNSAY
ncbi:sugar transferase [Enterococcus sp. FDAARGOS_375]|uniref:sugar transferase n=1 Tax=Enterococcus sp. FDAARGOS_375 TaxID=2060307 RepID=UPI000BBD2FF8|nr:sugar transferase [Enterococcus sp. FDAARGOS_375]ATF70905.1 UDP-phosphate galactose phosphotransferase [Enterococcus sp. FDAARGOS_375]